MAELYWDCAAAMPPEKTTLDFYHRMLAGHFANQEAIHLLAYRERQALTQAGRELAQLLTGNGDDPVIWGGSATEIFRIIATAPDFKTALISNLEHPAIPANFRHLTPEVWKSDRQGTITPGKAAVVPDLACFHHIQSELGVIQNTSGLFAQLPGCCRMVDAVQAAGKMPLPAEADIWVISGVKFGSPGGAAAILRRESKFTDMLCEHAEKLRKEQYALSRVSVPLALAMVYALKQALAQQPQRFENLQFLRNTLINKCRKWQIVPTLPETAPVSPYILNLLLPEQQSAIVVRALSERGIFIASGSACSAESDTPSAAMLAIGRNRREAYRSLRLSFRGDETPEDADFFLFELENVLKNY